MDAFVGEIRLLPYTYPPQNWAWCNGQLMSVQQYQALYSIIGNTYGGVAMQTFNLPNMQGTIPIGKGSGPGLTPRVFGANAVNGSTNSVTITANQTANHTHTVTLKFTPGNAVAASANMTAKPTASSWLSRTVNVTSSTTATTISNFTASSTPDTTFLPQTITPAGGSATAVEAHENRQPFMPINFCVCTNGYYPVNPN